MLIEQQSRRDFLKNGALAAAGFALLNNDLLPKICDFGISKHLTESLSLHTKIMGTFEYIAPVKIK